MCEKCGFSGCNHDWKKWQLKWYTRGYDDAINGRSAKSPELMLSESGYMAGYEQAVRDYRETIKCHICGDLMIHHSLPCEEKDENEN